MNKGLLKKAEELQIDNSLVVQHLLTPSKAGLIESSFKTIKELENGRKIFLKCFQPTEEAKQLEKVMHE